MVAPKDMVVAVVVVFIWLKSNAEQVRAREKRHPSTMVNYKKYANQSYSELKENAKKSGQLFTDNIFTAETSSLFYSRSSPPFPVEWKRPKVTCC